MNSGFESLGRYLIITIVVFAIGFPLRIWLRKRALKKYPKLLELQKIKGEIRSLKEQKQSYKEIIAIIKSQYTFPKYIIEGFIIDIENEEKTNIENPNKCIKANFIFKYPQNWRVKPLDPTLDQDKYFIIEGSYSGIVSFSIFQNTDKSVPSVDDMNDVLAIQYKKYQVKETFAKWGHFMGNGNLFNAQVLNNTMSGKVFRYMQNNNGFCITIAFMDDDYQNVSEGFKIIEDSFKALK